MASIFELCSAVSPSSRLNISDCHHLKPWAETGADSTTAATTAVAMIANRRESVERVIVSFVGQYDRGTIFVYSDLPGLAKASSLRMTVPTRLSGVEAPDVNPIERGPDPGSHPIETRSSLPPTGLCRISDGDMRPAGSAMWNVGTFGSQIRARLHVLLLLYPPMTIIRSSGHWSSNAATASCRSCVALQMVSKERNRASSSASP